MIKVLLATVVGILAVTAPLPAHADGAHFRGNCRIATLNDTTPGGRLGGEDTWNGEIDIAVVANDLGPISATCSIRVNFGPETVVLDAGSGTGAVAAAGRVTFTAAVTDVVQVCTNVTTSFGTEHCAYRETTPICPEEICGDGGLLAQILAVVDGINEQTKILDPIVCAQLIAIAPTVDDLATAGVLYVDPATGDTFAGAHDDGSLVWDCPPYVGP